MSEKNTEKGVGGRTLLSVVLAAVFIAAAFAIITADSNSSMPTDEKAYIGSGGEIYYIGTGTGGGAGNDYEDLETLLYAVTLEDGDVIILTSDVSGDSVLVIGDIGITIYLDEFDLTFALSSGVAIEVQSGGELTINSEGGSLYFSFASGSGNKGVYANGGTVTVNCDIIASGAYFYAVSTDSTDGGTVTVNGDINATGNSSTTVGVNVFSGGTVTVDGNVFVDGREAYGVSTANNNSKAFVTGDVTVIASNSHAVGVWAQSSGNVIEVGGKVTVTNKGTTASYLAGVYAYNNNTVTIGGCNFHRT